MYAAISKVTIITVTARHTVGIASYIMYRCSGLICHYNNIICGKGQFAYEQLYKHTWLMV